MPARWIVASVYVVSGVASALAGLLIAARLGSGSSNAAVGFELQVIAAVVLGGTSLMGGRGTHPRHRPRRADHRRDRQRPDPDAHLALLHPDRHRRDHPRRDLAQHPHLHRPARPAAEEAMSELSEAHVRSGQVMTVLGADPRRPTSALTLMHEHILNDCSLLVEPAQDPDRAVSRRRAAHASRSSGSCARTPSSTAHNIAPRRRGRSRSRSSALFAARGRPHRRRPDLPRHRPQPGGAARASPRRPASTSSWARATTSSPRTRPRSPRLSADAIADQIVAEATDGRRRRPHRPDRRDRRLLGLHPRRAQVAARRRPRRRRRTGLPLMVHLPGWFRLGHEVLDIVEAEGGDPRHTVLCHMNPSSRRFRLPARPRRAAAPSSSTT